MTENQDGSQPFGIRNPFLDETLRRARQAGFLSEAVHTLAPPDSRKGLGQNFLIDPETIHTLAGLVIPGRTVIEVGPGFGVLTEKLAEPAGRLIGIELDRRFNRVLSDVVTNSQTADTSDQDQAKKGKIRFVNTDALDWQHFINLDALDNKPQIISNLPFGIAGQFMASLVGMPIENAVFFLGDAAWNELNAMRGDKDYGHMSTISPFFEIDKIAEVGEGCFFPKSDTTGKIVVMTPKDPSEIGDATETRVFSQIFRDTQEALVPPTVLISMSRALGKDDADVVIQIQRIYRSLDPHSLRPTRWETASNLQKPFFRMKRPEVKEFGRIVHLLDQTA